MSKPGIRYYLFASLLLHAATLLPLISMATSRKTDMKAVEVFIVEPSAVSKNIPQQLFHDTATGAKGSRARDAVRPQERDASANQTPRGIHENNAGQAAAHAAEPLQIAAQPAPAGHKPDAEQGVLPASAVSRESAGSRSAPVTGGAPGTTPGAATEAVVEMKMGDAGAPGFIHREAPVYPFMARKLGKEGRVVLRLTLNENGGLMDIEVVVNAGYGFTEAAISAVKKSVFSPARKDGKPVVSKVALPVRFVLRGEGS